jgi:peptide/nickel transport system permease protein
MTTTVPEVAELREPTRASRLLRDLREGRPGVRGATIGATILLLLLLVGFFLPLPYDPTTPDVTAILKAPSASHIFGTDVTGFDVFSRTIASARRDLPLALIGTLLSLVVGVPLGLLASSKAWYSGWLMRGLDVFQAFPLVIIAIAVVTLTGNHIGNVVVAIAVINAPRFMRLVRSEALSLRESRFVEAAHSIGASPARVMVRHMLPNVTGVILVQVSLAAANAIIVIASLNFLGVGVSPPDPTWGSMIQQGAEDVTTGEWWTVAFPGLAVLIAVLSFNLVADGLEHMTESRGGR